MHVHTAGGGKGYTQHVHTAGDGRRYILHVHTAGGGKEYTMHVHTAGGGKGYTLHVHTAGGGEVKTLASPCHSAAGGKVTPCTSTLMVVEGGTPCMSILQAVEGGTVPYTLHVKSWRWKGIHLWDTPCTSKLLVVEKVHGEKEYILHVHTADSRNGNTTSIDGCLWCYSCYMMKNKSECRNAGKRKSGGNLPSVSTTLAVYGK
jgi:hypothetical protein